MDYREHSLDAQAREFNASLDDKERSWLNARGLRDSTISSALLGYVADGRYAHSISIPYLNPDGSVRSIRFRYLRSGGQKYDNIKGQEINLYGVKNSAKSRVWLCEGEFDALILQQMGFPAVGLPGANGFKPDWKWLFVNCEQVSIVLDGDEAGTKAAGRLSSVLGEVVHSLRLLRLPEGMDVTDVYLRDPQELRKLVA